MDKEISPDSGDGLLADKGMQDFGELTGAPSTAPAQRQQGAPAQGQPGQSNQQNTGTSESTGTDGIVNMRRAKPGAVVDEQGQQPNETNGGQLQTGTQTGGQGQQTGGQGQQTQGIAQQPDLSAIIKSTVEATTNALNGNRQQQSQQTTTAEQPLSPEAFDRKYGIIRPNEEMITHIIGQDPKRAAATLNTLFQSNMTATLRMANDIVEAKLSQVRTEYEPHVKSWTAHQQAAASKAAEDGFYTTHTDLANERDIVNDVKDAMILRVQSGQVKFTTQAEANLAVANAARAIIQRFRGGSGTGGQSQQTGQQNGRVGGVQTPPPPSGRQMSAASSAGRTGTGQAMQKSDVDEVFGSDAR